MDSDWDKKRKALISRLRRVEGQLRGIQRMMEEDQDCERVAQQLSAARKALDKTFFETMACALQQEIAKHETNEGATDDQIRHITALLSKYA
ncbi:metal-sensing transcriptional repressor [Spongiibacter taiwanensis]|uniref:metal-sensing transcriptional repressor n=1 Tax=Spongiibacter taiwanensis TaxID=1748242 RepID=UPI002034A91E|nr:metal-sensing transcriptional repressor [Spongiibacter taiwanensis]USA41856.1 metal-sensing transcriptional repressor [Spongiibacter taiwanensis]